MGVAVNVSGTWKSVNKPYIKIVNDWKPLLNIWKNVNGVWKPLFKYTWIVGPWTNCTVNCGGGTQTRTVYCQRQDGQVVDDIYCTLS